MKNFELALAGLQRLVRLGHIHREPYGRDHIALFSHPLGTFALELPRKTRDVQGAKFWFSFPFTAGSMRASEVPAGKTRNNALNQSVLGSDHRVWSLLIRQTTPDAASRLAEVLEAIEGTAGRRSLENADYASAVLGGLIASVDGAERPPVSTGPVEAPDAAEEEGTGFESDPRIRRAVERRAVEVARKYYEKQNYSVVEKGKPYDLLCEKDGQGVHVEVKGSRGALDHAILTVNEVIDARDAAWRSDLLLVDNISVTADGTGDYTATGGRVRLISDWVPAETDLRAIQFRYQIPLAKIVELDPQQ